MTQSLLEQIVQGRTGENSIREQYRAWKAAMPAPASEQHCKPSGGPAARVGRFVGVGTDGLAEYLMPEGF